VFEGHPLDWVWDTEAAEFKLNPDPQFGNYFSTSIDIGQGWPAQYIAEEEVPAPEEQSAKHERQWTLGQIMNALVTAGLRLERFEEHPDQYWDQLPNVPAEIANCLPHTFSLLMRRE